MNAATGLSVMRYDAHRYLYPPRPQVAVPRLFASQYENEGWWAQYKLEGTNNVLAVSPERQIVARGRHGPQDEHRNWSPTLASSRAFHDLPGTGWYVFVAELMHSKVTNGPRDTNYLNDILVADGRYLVGTTFVERQAILADLFPELSTSPGLPSHYAVTPNTWVARNHRTGFVDLFDSLTDPCHEGLVFKQPNARLALCSRESANTAWLAKLRKSKKNLSF